MKRKRYTSREHFEAWALPYWPGRMRRNRIGGYQDTDVDIAWFLWRKGVALGKRRASNTEAKHGG